MTSSGKCRFLKVNGEYRMKIFLAKAVAVLMAVCCASLHSRAQAGEAKGMQVHYQVVYARGDGGGYHTYRIPAVVVTGKGTILAFCEARKNSKADEGDIDIVVKRSFDQGETWGPMQLVHEEGGTAPITIARFNLEWLTDGADSIGTETK